MTTLARLYMDQTKYIKQALDNAGYIKYLLEALYTCPSMRIILQITNHFRKVHFNVECVTTNSKYSCIY